MLARTAPLRLAAFVFACGALACTRPATEVLVRLDTNVPESATMIVSVEVAGADAGVTRSDASPQQSWVRGPGGTLHFPASFGVTPPESGARDGNATLVINVHIPPTQSGDVARSMRRVARFRFVPSTPMSLPIFLDSGCADLTTGCTSVLPAACSISARCEEQGMTCGDRGQCVTQAAELIPLRGDAGARADAPFDGVAPVDARDVARDNPTDAARCARDSDCPASAPHCDTANGACVACLADADCGAERCDATQHICVPRAGCTAGPCNDGNPCTHTDTCSSGVCAGTAYSCSPGACETASCNGSGGCDHASTCGSSEVCSGGSCVACGGPGQACCSGDWCGGGEVCAGGTCVLCGGADQACCAGGACNSGACWTGVCTCGQVGNVCCSGGGCDPAMNGFCSGGTCARCTPYGSPCTGDPCCGGIACRGGLCIN